MIAEKIKTLLLQIPSARLVSGGKEIAMRCPYCGDSKRDRNAAHFYVSIPQDDNVSLFHCFRASCLVSGVTTSEKLIEWNIFDPDTAIELTKYNKQVLSLDKNKKFKQSEVYILNNNYISPSKLSEVKLKYINNRLGTNLTYTDLLNQKIVLNLGDLLLTNNITTYTRDPRIIKELDESFLGFISPDNAFVNMRNLREGKVSKSIDKKYVNYSIFNKLDNTQKYYTLPTTIDLTNPNRIQINIAEGPFDILSVYYNMNTNHNHSIFSAILGGGYLGICKHFIHTMKLINLEFHVYIDNDVDDYMIYDVRDYLKVYHIPLYIHRNVAPNEKDFGVNKSRIQERVYLLR